MAGPMPGKNILVVGGAGFIGSNLVRRLLVEGHRPSVVDDLLTGARTNVPEDVPFTEASAADADFIDRCGRADWDAVFHLGGASSAPLFDDDPLRLTDAIACFQNVLEVARGADAPVAFASTSSFYARCEKPYREDMHVVPSTLYEASKLSMENLGRAYAAMYGVPVTAFRFFSVYGPHERAKGRYANIVSQFLWCLRGGIRPLLYGDGTQTRDFTYVGDLVDGILGTYDRTEGFEVYNIGTGVEHTFLDVLDLLNRELGTDVEAASIPNPVRNYVQETLADTGRLEATGWRARTSLEEGIRRLVREEAPPEPALIERMREAHEAPLATV